MERVEGTGGWLAMAGFGLGAIGLMLVMVHFWAGPFAPQPALEDVIADTAVGIRAAAERAMSGAPAAVEARAYDIDDILRIVGPVLAGTALIASLAAFATGAPWRLAAGGVVLGGTAILFQVVTWIAMVVIGVLLMGYILSNITEILGG
ncbi:MAG: hypothetical protein AAFR52_17540 [Pseudomonadota bacterium]